MTDDTNSPDDNKSGTDTDAGDDAGVATNLWTRLEDVLDNAIDEDDVQERREEIRERWQSLAETASQYGELAGEHLAGSVQAMGRGGKAFVKTTGRLLVESLKATARASSSIPLAEKFWKGMVYTSVDAYHKAAGGDALAMNARADRAEFLPVKWQDGEDVEDERGWKAKGRDKVWHPGNEGRGTTRLSKTPFITTDQDAPQKYSFAEARVAEAIDLGQYQPLYKADEVTMDVEIEQVVDAQNMSGGAGGAVADGGVEMSYDAFIEPEKAKGMVLADALVDIMPDGDYDGMRISTTKVKEIYQEKTGSEYQKQAETRGRLAGMSRNDMKAFMFRIFLIAGMIVLGALLGPDLINALLGGGAGGGSGISIPII